MTGPSESQLQNQIICSSRAGFTCLEAHIHTAGWKSRPATPGACYYCISCPQWGYLKKTTVTKYKGWSCWSCSFQLERTWSGGNNTRGRPSVPKPTWQHVLSSALSVRVISLLQLGLGVETYLLLAVETAEWCLNHQKPLALLMYAYWFYRHKVFIIYYNTWNNSWCVP